MLRQNNRAREEGHTCILGLSIRIQIILLWTTSSVSSFQPSMSTEVSFDRSPSYLQALHTVRRPRILFGLKRKHKASSILVKYALLF